MLPLAHRIAFLLFAGAMLAFGAHGFYRVFRRIRAGRPDTESRFDNLPTRLRYALITTLTQSRTFRKRPVISLLHSFIFYGFVFYLLVNAVDAVDGFFPLSIHSQTPLGAAYNLAADVLSMLVLVGVVALVLRRFSVPSRRDFRFNDSTLLHPDIEHGSITRDSLIVSTFILLHVGSRALGMGARLALEGPDRFQPFATLLSHTFVHQHPEAWGIVGFWGALGSVLAFLVYFPYSKHIHIFMASAKYAVARQAGSGVLPPLDLNLSGDAPAGEPSTVEEGTLGAAKLEELAWPRLLDAYACIQCNRCQDVCPATATGKSLSPSALEINKRMELNTLARQVPSFEAGAASPRPLLAFALTPEALWACTTCGACMQACPVQDEPMFDLIDMRRQQVMMEGTFPAQLQSAFRGMERAKNPWGIAQEQRLAWADGLHVRTMDQNPNPDVLYWVGCAASYDPQAQKTARAFVQLLQHAGVNFSVLGKQECCTGDSARRAGNEYLYRQLAETNVQTLGSYAPKLIVATCPHCMNAIGKEYRQLGGEFKVMHHTEYLDSLVADGKLAVPAMAESVAFHDPCYLGRHNDVYDAPRNLLHILSNDVRELDRTRENSFCCGAGGAQFWKEEEAGSERVSDNRYREAEHTLAAGSEQKVLAVGCPFCKSMLQSTPGKNADVPIAVKDVAELLWESIAPAKGAGIPVLATAESVHDGTQQAAPPRQILYETAGELQATLSEVPSTAPLIAGPSAAKRAKWDPKAGTKAATSRSVAPAAAEPVLTTSAIDTVVPPATPAPEPQARPKWSPKPKTGAPPSAELPPRSPDLNTDQKTLHAAESIGDTGRGEGEATPPARKKWTPCKPDA